ncbi:MAG: hypothetical protein ACUVQU_06980 [Candidatus Bipolaricaulia bacterium]
MAKRTVGMTALSYPHVQRGLFKRRSGVGVSLNLNRPWEGLEGKEESPALAFAVLVSVMVLIAALAFLFIWQGWRLTALHSELSVRRVEVERLAAENEALKLKIERAFSLERISLYARTVLGMVEPPLRYLYLRLTQPGR